MLGMAQLCLPKRTRLTNGAKRLIHNADDVGVPPGSILQTVLSAARSAEREGRTRVGPFGGAKTAFENLRVEALRKKQESLIHEGTRRPR